MRCTYRMDEMPQFYLKQFAIRTDWSLRGIDSMMVANIPWYRLIVHPMCVHVFSIAHRLYNMSVYSNVFIHEALIIQFRCSVIVRNVYNAVPFGKTKSHTHIFLSLSRLLFLSGVYLWKSNAKLNENENQNENGLTEIGYMESMCALKRNANEKTRHAA